MARVFYHTSVLDDEINPEMPWKQSKADPEGNGPGLRRDKFWSGEPTMVNLYRMLKKNNDGVFKNLDRMSPHFDRQDTSWVNLRRR